MRAAHLLTSTALLVMAVAPAPASQLSQIISKGNHLITLNRLGITEEQVDELLLLAEQLTGATKTWQSKRQDLLAEHQDPLARARQAMIEGRSMGQASQEAFEALEAALEENDDALYEAAVEVLGKVRGELFPSQNAYIDWTPPKGTAKTPRETVVTQAEREREYRAMVLFAEQFLTRVRYYPLEQYILQAQKVVDDFLRPLIPIASPAYPRAQQFMFRLVDEVRLLGEPQWQAQRRTYATTLVGELGLFDAPEEAIEERPYTWQDLYAIFSDPGTPDTLREIKAALAED
jgi:hypothetical protein